jgi:hypothetical protein
MRCSFEFGRNPFVAALCNWMATSNHPGRRTSALRGCCATTTAPSAKRATEGTARAGPARPRVRECRRLRCKMTTGSAACCTLDNRGRRESRGRWNAGVYASRMRRGPLLLALLPSTGLSCHTRTLAQHAMVSLSSRLVGRPEPRPGHDDFVVQRSSWHGVLVSCG